MHQRWEQHREIIKWLYVEERKTLRDVKKILEEQYAFPTAPESSYENNISQLGLIKKLKREHWRILYQRFEEGSRKPFDLYVDGVILYEWPTVWKELRRNRKKPMPSNLQLPEGLRPQILQVPDRLPKLLSPAPIQTTSCLSQSIIPLEGSLRCPTTRNPSFGHTVCNLGPVNLSIRAKLHKLPWNETRIALFRLLINPEAIGNYETVNATQLDITPLRDMLNLLSGKQAFARISNNTFPSPWHLEVFHILPSMQLTPNLDTFNFLNRLFYLVSNRLLSVYDDRHRLLTQNVLDMLSSRSLQDPLVYCFFEARFPSARSTWEGLLKLSTELRHSKGFTFILKLAVSKHVDWIRGARHSIIKFASLSENLDTLKKAIMFGVSYDEEVGVEPYIYFVSFAIGIMRATKLGRIDCVKLLIGAVPFMINHQIFSEHVASSALAMIFGIFILDAEFRLFINSPIPTTGLLTIEGKNKDIFFKVVDEFLCAGADLDCMMPVSIMLSYPPLYEARNYECLNRLYQRLDTGIWGAPNVFEWLLYLDTALFPQLHPYSRASSRGYTVTRSGICEAALKGDLCLAMYLDSKTTEDTLGTRKFLELTLVEQFVLSDLNRVHGGYIHSRIARGLISYGVTISDELKAHHGGETGLAKKMLVSNKSSGLSDDVHFIVNYLFRHGAVIDLSMMEEMIGTDESRVMEALVPHCGNLLEYGADLLVAAASVLNFEAVEWLLRRGADINGQISSRSYNESTQEFFGIQPVTVLGAVTLHFAPRNCICHREESRSRADLFTHRSRRSKTSRMIRYLLNAGARLRLNQSDPNACRFLQVFAYNCDASWEELFRLFTSFPGELDGITSEEWQKILLELLASGYFYRDTHWRISFFQTLRRRYYFSGDTGPFLSHAIFASATDDVIQDLIKNTNIFDSYSLSVFHPRKVQTPLQAAASQGNQNLVLQLFSLGAAVNLVEPPYPKGFFVSETALQAICQWNPVSAEEHTRKTNIINILINNGAIINDRKHTSLHTPLMYCVAQGEMEHTILLLEHGADPNLIGLDYLVNGHPLRVTALDIAARGGRFDIAYLLLQFRALSGRPGQTGCDGAIKIALDWGNSAIAELIERHIAKKDNATTTHPTHGIGIRNEKLLPQTHNPVL